MRNTECHRCGIVFSLTDAYYARRVDDHQTFYCPNGHGQSFVAETEAEKYKRLYEKQCASQNDVCVRLEAAERAKNKVEKKLSNLKKRAATGVCPCCTRTVSQLAKHMETQHPDFRELAGLNPVKQLPEKVQ